MPKTPTHKIKIGLITATIWNNDGFYSVDIMRSYKSAQNDWKNANGFYQSDLLNVSKCAERAEYWISQQAAAH